MANETCKETIDPEARSGETAAMPCAMLHQDRSRDWELIRGVRARRLPLVTVVVVIISAFLGSGAAGLSGDPAKVKPSDAAAPVTTGAKIIHVDARHALASDRNPGTEKHPLSTIGQAAQRSLKRYERGLSTEVVIAPGVYRESIAMAGSGRSTGGSIVFRGTPGTVVSGSDVWRGWQAVSGTRVYSHPWPFKWRRSAVPKAWRSTYAGSDLAANPVIRRREMIFVDGQLLRQELSLRKVASTPGSFFVAQRRGTVYLSPPDGKDIGGAVVEVAVRPELFAATQVDRVELIEMTFRHAASGIEGQAVRFVDASGIRIVGSRFLWNNWIGLGVSGSKDVTIASSVANHNGVGGMSGAWIDGLLVQDSETSYNNWRGSRGVPTYPGRALDGNFIDFATGQKFFRLRDAAFLRHRAVGNLSGGLWLDWDNEGVVLEQLDMRGNLTHGLFVEASQGPIAVRDSVFCGNETGILIGNSENGTIERNLFRNNAAGQIFIVGDPSADRPVQNRGTGKWMNLRTRNWAMLNNVVTARDGQRALGTYLNPPIWSSFVETLTSHGNAWMYEGSPAIFQVAGGDHLDLEGWRAHTGEDTSSLSEEGEVACI